MTTDYLAFEVIKALRKTQMAESWIKDKEHEFKDMTRLQVRSLSNLDSDNLQAVADQICVSIEDMQATLRVLKNLNGHKRTHAENLEFAKLRVLPKNQQKAPAAKQLSLPMWPDAVRGCQMPSFEPYLVFRPLENSIKH
jgi:DNA-binding transcriptional regulator GbsR (MarR family)